MRLAVITNYKRMLCNETKADVDSENLIMLVQQYLELIRA